MKWGELKYLTRHQFYYLTHALSANTCYDGSRQVCQYGLFVRENTDASQSHQGIDILRGDQDNLRVGSCDDTCPHAYQVSYMSLLPLGIDVICVLGTFEIDYYKDSWPQIIIVSFVMLSVWDLRLSPQHGGSGPLRFHEVGWQCLLHH